MAFHGNNYSINMPVCENNTNNDDDEDYPSNSKLKKVKKIIMKQDICPFCKAKLDQRELEYKKDSWGDTIEYLKMCGYCKKMYKVFYKLSHMVKVKQDETLDILYHKFVRDYQND